MSEKNLRRLKQVFYALIVLFILILITNFLIPMLLLALGFERGVLGILFLPLTILFFLLGAILIFLTLKSRIGGKLKLFLLLTGVSSVISLISIILHNLLEALGMEILSVVFFFIAILISPIGFLIGAIGSIILFKGKGGRNSPQS